MTEYDSIAVTGLSCRLPGNCNTLENFWQSICAGESAWSEIPKERFNNDAFWSPNKRRATNSATGAHFMQEDLSKFDAGFFGLPKHDVDAMDPQQRIMMEVAYEALERAGLPLHQLAGTRTGVFMGISSTDYRDMICRDLDNSPQYTFTGTCPASVANRLSWLWDLRGPSFPVNTACSSSLVALNLACQSLRTGESDIAIVGASSVLLYPEMFVFLSNHGFLAPDGKCKSFDASADGYGRGEGFGCIILKRTGDAIAAGDPIRAVIRGTGSNQDGRTKGLTMPSAEAQGTLIDEVYKKAGLEFNTTTYVEAHGTGTKLGDLEEMEALATTIAGSQSADNKLIVGSVKTNIGHLEAAAGIAGIIKAVLMLETGLIPPNINFNRPNPNIQWDKWNVTIPTELTPWPTDGLRRISVNSFGYGGSNGHVVLDDAYHYLAARKLASNGQVSNGVCSIDGDVTNGVSSINGVPTFANGHTTSLDRPRSRLFVWSAQDKDGLKRIEQPLARYIQTKAAGYHTSSPYEKDKTDDLMAELAYTLSERRSRLQWKTYAIASSPEELAACLTASDDERHVPPTVKSSRSPRLGFVFTGQGAQWPRMGVELMVYEAFRESMEAADRYLQQDCGCAWSAVDELQKNKTVSPINQALYSHGLTCILQIALLDLLRTWNIFPTAVVGHSGGEIAASYASGGLSRQDAWKVAYYRGFVASRLKLKAPHIDGAMMAVGLSSEVAEEWITKVTDGELVVACINSPTSTTIAGDSTGIEQLLVMLKAAGIFAKKLFVDTAYHSPHMAYGAKEYCERIADIKPIADPKDRCSMYSTVTGNLIEPGDLGVQHWIASITGPVLFSKGVYDLVRPYVDGKRQEENAVDVLLEIGPHSVLQGPSTQSLKAHGITNIPYHSVLTRHMNAADTAMATAGVLFAQGCQVNVREVNGDSHLHFDSPLVDLPTYPWNHLQRFWHNCRIDNEFLSRNAPKPGILGAPWPSVAEGEQLWKGFLRLSEAPWIADHKIQGSVLYPGAGYIAMAIEAAVQTADPSREISAFNLRDIQLTAAGIISEDADLECIVRLRPHMMGTRDSASTWTEFSVTTSPDGTSLLQNCRGLILIEYQPTDGSNASREKVLEQQAIKAQFDEAQQSCINRIDPEGFYADMRSWGLDYGPVFSNVYEARNRDGQSVGAVKLPDVPMPGVTGRPYVIHPGTLDAVFHLAFAAVKGGRHDPTTAMVPKSIDSVIISASIPFEAGIALPGFANAGRYGLNELNADIFMFDGDTQLPVITIEGFLCAEILGASASVVAKSLAGKLTWKPEIGLLAPEKLAEILSQLPDGERMLSEYLQLLHHASPALSVLEVAADLDSPLFQQSGLANLAQTWDVSIAIPDENPINENIQPESIKILDFGKEFPEDTPKEQYDVLVLSNAVQLSSTLDLGQAIARMCKVVKQNGTLFFLITDSIFTDIQSVMDAIDMEITIHRSIDTNLIVAKKPSIPRPNGNTNDLANGTVDNHIKGLSNGLTNEHTDGLFNGYINGHTNGHTNGQVSRHTNGYLNGFSNGATNDAKDLETEAIIILATNPTVLALAVASNLVAILQKHHCEVGVFSWRPDVSPLKGKSCISLLELEKSFLKDLRAQDFEPLKKLILETKSLFWVTALNDPSNAMIDGLVRAVRNETPGLDVRVLHADESSSLFAPAQRFADLLAQAFLWDGQDNEFRVKDDILHTSRVKEDTVLNEEINSLLPGATKAVAEAPLGEIEYPVKLCVRSPGMLSSVCMKPDESAETELEPDFIEIETKATALNFREIMVAMGQMADTELGLDAAGIVRRVGSSISKFKIGDKVIMMGYGAHRVRHRAPASFCTLIPEGMSFELAASIPVVHATAYNALVRVARVQKGQSILIHAAAGGVGQVACQISQHFGLEIFATVSSEDKKKLICEQYGVREDHVFSSRDTSFAKGIKRMTNGRGVDVVLNSLAGEMLRRTWHCIAPFGHFVEIGIKDILNNTGLEMRPFLQDATFTFFNLRHVEESRPDLMAEILAGAFDFIHRGITRPVEPVITFPISDVEGALRLMQTGKHIGKIALTWGKDHVVPLIRRGMRAPKLSPKGVYMLVGGLGGLGRSLATKLVSLGARKLCFLSRSGAKSSHAMSLIQKLEQQDVNVKVLRCDVSDGAAVANAIERCTQDQGKIRGVFQCAMVLRDGLFVNMSYQSWVESTQPKVQGSWNLHKYLPGDLDFFIILSSFTGVFGSRGQSNYGSAGAYEDALAYHRRALGRHSTTIDLGLMRDVGVLAETGMTDSFRDWEKPYGIREDEFHALIERVVDRDMLGTEDAQVITGLATGGSARVAGIDTPYYLEDQRFSILARTGLRDSASTATHDDTVPTHALIGKATTMQEAVALAQEAFVKQVAKMLQTDPTEVDTSRFLHSYGFDSLVAIEIVNWVLKEIKSIITVFDVLSGIPITALCHRIAAKSAALPKELTSV
ncbi:hypothetical protein S40293_05963 [Stachybotrys chartarum IBT 40293]|nr:hypothetical protein S40293_05963 [Stachybotrys chartarum IBT 40293]